MALLECALQLPQLIARESSAVSALFLARIFCSREWNTKFNYYVSVVAACCLPSLLRARESLPASDADCCCRGLAVSWSEGGGEEVEERLVLVAGDPNTPSIVVSVIFLFALLVEVAADSPGGIIARSILVS